MLVIDKLSADSPYHHLAVERLYLPGISDISDIKYITYIRNELVNLIWSDPVFSPFLSQVHSISHYGRSQPRSQAPLPESESLGTQELGGGERGPPDEHC